MSDSNQFQLLSQRRYLPFFRRIKSKTRIQTKSCSTKPQHQQTCLSFRPKTQSPQRLQLLKLDGQMNAVKKIFREMLGMLYKGVELFMRQDSYSQLLFIAMVGLRMKYMTLGLIRPTLILMLSSLTPLRTLFSLEKNMNL